MKVVILVTVIITRLFFREIESKCEDVLKTLGYDVFNPEEKN